MKMTDSKSKEFRILAIAPSVHTVGFAVLHDRHTLADWGLKNIEGKKNTSSLSIVEHLIGTYEPDVLVFEDVHATGARRSPRIQELLKQIDAMAKGRKLAVRTFGRQQVVVTHLARKGRTPTCDVRQSPSGGLSRADKFSLVCI